MITDVYTEKEFWNCADNSWAYLKYSLKKSVKTEKKNII